ncbi:MAG: DNA-processing protein DprA [Myxococcales bacterium]|nr:DNA-processing protein DprA [Myxococcales bacterium]MDH3484948.1 DNA-processing protein DprA [Myxococcales bacterium]
MLDALSERARVVASSGADYPSGLRHLSDAPEHFRIVGDLPDLSRSVSIVGTRLADDEALDFTYGFARKLAFEGVVVVSGGAVGIDRAAHEGALDGGGRTIVVLPIGFDKPYPAANHNLFERVIEAGCLLTEVPDGAEMQKGRFLTRNRLVAALGQSTIVIQAPARSGALSTARHANALGRHVFTTPASPWDPRGSGNLVLLRKGARICMVPGDVLSGSAVGAGVFEAPGSKKGRDNPNYSNLSTSEQQILDALRGRARHAEDLCHRTGIPAFEVQRSILSLLVRGLVEEKPGGRFQSCRRSTKPY